MVLLCEPDLPDGAWSDLLADTLRLPLPPPLIVVARHADESLWMDVLQRGGYNVLGMPFEEREAFRLVSMAWLNLRDRALHQRAAGSSVPGVL